MSTDRVVVHAGIISERLATAMNRRTPVRELHDRLMAECRVAAREGRELPAGHAGDLYAIPESRALYECATREVASPPGNGGGVS